MWNAGCFRVRLVAVLLNNFKSKDNVELRRLNVELIILITLFIITFNRAELKAEEFPLYLTYAADDFPASMVLPKGQLELDLRYAVFNDAVDVFGFREKEKDKLAVSSNFSFGDYRALSLGVHYGLTHHLMLSFGYDYRTLGYQGVDLNLSGLKFSARYSLNGCFAVDIGVKYDQIKDTSVTNVEYINYYLHKFKSNLNLEVDSQYVWYVLTYPDMVVRYGLPKTAEPELRMEDLQDYTGYIRFTLGKAWEKFYPNIFFELGYTHIDTKMDTNLKDMIPDGYMSYLPDFPLDMSREEKYISAGFSLFFQTPYDTITHIEYTYMYLFRDADINYAPKNQIIRADIAYLLTQNIILHVGGTYLHSQFNGVVPFLYNKYTQTTFDHPYGWAEVGVSYLF